MAIFRVEYHSMSASYGPNFIEAEDEYEARRIFASTAFSKNEMSLIKAKKVSAKEMMDALNKNKFNG